MENEDKKVGESANNIQLKWKDTKDKPAVEAIREVAKELGCDAKSAARWICVHCKTHAIQKAKEIQELLKAG